MQKDNSTLGLKVQLRLKALSELSSSTPVVLETHGGFGKIFSRCYAHVRDGIVFDCAAERAVELARSRPTWSVYEGDCEQALAAGAGAHLEVNFLDCDPYGQAWNAIDGFLFSDRPKAKRLVVCVNDGLKHKLELTGGWDVKSMHGMIDKYGSKLSTMYLEVCKELMTQKASDAGYKLKRWTCYGTGAGNVMTHFAAVLDRG